MRGGRATPTTGSARPPNYAVRIIILQWIALPAVKPAACHAPILRSHAYVKRCAGCSGVARGCGKAKRFGMDNDVAHPAPSMPHKEQSALLLGLVASRVVSLSAGEFCKIILLQFRSGSSVPLPPSKRVMDWWQGLVDCQDSAKCSVALARASFCKLIVCPC